MSRADRLWKLVAERELDSLLVTNLVNVRYLTGFTGSNGLCLVGDGSRVFMTDFRYVTQAAEQVEGFDEVQGKQDLLADAAERMAGRVGFDDASLTVRQHQRLRELAGGRFELVAAGGLVERMRSVKEPGELQAITSAAVLADEILEYAARRPFAGHTEREVAIDLEREMRARGSDPSFATIVAAGPNGALPHAEPRDAPIERDTLVIVDLGCVVDGYCSDCTRTFATGELFEEAASVYGVVGSVQRESVAAVRPGAEGKELDTVARKQIADAGYGEHFGHGLGHGVGLEVHEGPRLSQLSEDTLVEGNVVTVEPGIYLPGQFGVRIEDLVFVTAEGGEIASRFPKELTTLE